MTLVLLPILGSVAAAQAFQSVTPLSNLGVTANTGEKPQSKVWTYDGYWWTVLSTSSGTFVYRLDGTTWSSVLQVSTATNAHADVKAVGGVSHILLYAGTSSQLVSIEYVPASDSYQMWTVRPAAVAITLDQGVETATIDIDSQGRMWLASDASTDINVRYSDSPYSTWNGPITLASGVSTDDICVVTTLNTGTIGVLWSNQNTQRFGFRAHTDGADAATWSPDEVPASQSALNVGLGMADDHLNVAVASDGTLYAAVKTSYDTPGYTKIGLLVRRTGGTWDDLYEVDQSGTRGIVVLNEAAGSLTVVYTSTEGSGNILYRKSNLAPIAFGAAQTLLSGGYNEATSTKQNYFGNIVLMATDVAGSAAASVLATDANANAYALDFDGTNDYVNCGTSSGADITGPLTLEAWVRPDVVGTQSIVKKNGTGSGYELSLANNPGGGLPQNYFFRLNGTDTYRVNSTSYYPIDGSWTHVAATYDGSVMKLYVNGIQEGSAVAGPASIVTNSNNVVIGTDAASIGTKNFTGGIDEVRIWNVARTAQQILDDYNKQISSATGLVARWGMAEGTGTSTVNSVGGGLDGTLMDGGSVGNGPLWISSTPFSAPAAPTLVSPANAAAGISLAPTLTWNASSGATSYRAQVSVTSDFLTTVFDESGITTTSALVTPDLSNSTLYYWRVNATGAQGTTDWSTVWSFTTVPAAPAVEDNGAGYALDFDGTNGSATSDYVNCGNGSSLDITQSLTIEAWVKPTATKTHSIVKKYATTSSGYELFLENATNGRMSFRLNGSTTYRVNSTTYYNQPSLSRWIHIAGTYDYASKAMKIFVNGREEGSITGPASIVSLPSPLVIGSELTDFSKSFQGSIDEVRVWNVARNDAEIKANMTRKLTGTEPGLVGYWRFNETTGTSVNDETSNNNDGTMTNMDPLTDHVWSGAALGDESAYDYVAADGYTAAVSHADGDALAATTTSGTIIGIQVYRADDPAVRTGSTMPAGYSLDPSRYWGVKAIGTSPVYTLVYNYAGNPSVTTETGLKLVKRDAISVADWTDALATLDVNANTLTVTGAPGTEYALAIPEAPATYQLTVTAGTGGTITAPPTSPVTVNHGEATTITAAANVGYVFTGWTIVSGTGVSIAAPSSPSTTVTLTGGNAEVMANFAVNTASALQFNGSNQYVTFGTASALGSRSFTLEGWVRRTGTGDAVSTGTGGVTAVPLITKGRGEADGNNRDMNYFLGINGVDSVLVADFEEGTGSASPGLNHPVKGVTKIASGSWHHVAATYDASNRRWRLFLDGLLEKDTVISAGTCFPQNLSIQHAGLATAMTSTGAAGGYLAGVMDEVRIWNYARTQLEIQQDINTQMTSPPASVLGRWGLNENSGTTAFNTVITGPNGTLTNSPAWVSPGAPFDIIFATPAAPTGLSAAALSTSQIDLAWVDNSSDEAAFEIERSDVGAGGPFTQIATVGAGVEAYSDGGLTHSTP